MIFLRAAPFSMKILILACGVPTNALQSAASVKTFGDAVKGLQLAPDVETDVYSFTVPAGRQRPNGTAACLTQTWLAGDTDWVRLEETLVMRVYVDGESTPSIQGPAGILHGRQRYNRGSLRAEAGGRAVVCFIWDLWRRVVSGPICPRRRASACFVGTASGQPAASGGKRGIWSYFI